MQDPDITLIGLEQMSHVGASGTLVSDEELAGASGFLQSQIVPGLIDPSQASFDSYDSVGAFNLTTAFTFLRLDTQRITGSNYVFSPPFGVQIQSDGIYRIDARVSTAKTSGNQRADSEFFININGVNLPGTRGVVYNRSTAQGIGTASSWAVMNLAAGNFVLVFLRHLSGAGTISTLADGSALTLKREA